MEGAIDLGSSSIKHQGLGITVFHNNNSEIQVLVSESFQQEVLSVPSHFNAFTKAKLCELGSSNYLTSAFSLYGL